MATTIKCIECPYEMNDWEKMNRHRELTGHRFKVVGDEERISDYQPKDFSENDNLEYLNS